MITSKKTTKADKAPTPFDNTYVEIGDLHLDSAEDRIGVSGSVDITRDKEGLAHAKRLADYFSKAVKLLEKELAAGDLPATTEIEAPVMKSNPLL